MRCIEVEDEPDGSWISASKSGVFLAPSLGLLARIFQLSALTGFLRTSVFVARQRLFSDTVCSIQASSSNQTLLFDNAEFNLPQDYPLASSEFEWFPFFISRLSSHPRLPYGVIFSTSDHPRIHPPLASITGNSLHHRLRRYSSRKNSF